LQRALASACLEAWADLVQQARNEDVVAVISRLEVEAQRLQQELHEERSTRAAVARPTSESLEPPASATASGSASLGPPPAAPSRDSARLQAAVDRLGEELLVERRAREAQQRRCAKLEEEAGRLRAEQETWFEASLGGPAPARASHGPACAGGTAWAVGRGGELLAAAGAGGGGSGSGVDPAYARLLQGLLDARRERDEARLEREELRVHLAMLRCEASPLSGPEVQLTAREQLLSARELLETASRQLEAHLSEGGRSPRWLTPGMSGIGGGGEVSSAWSSSPCSPQDPMPFGGLGAGGGGGGGSGCGGGAVLGPGSASGRRGRLEVHLQRSSGASTGACTPRSGAVTPRGAGGCGNAGSCGALLGAGCGGGVVNGMSGGALGQIFGRPLLAISSASGAHTGGVSTPRSSSSGGGGGSAWCCGGGGGRPGMLAEHSLREPPQLLPRPVLSPSPFEDAAAMLRASALGPRRGPPGTGPLTPRSARSMI